MPFAVLLIGAILVIVAFNNSAPALVNELEADIPPYFKWAAAIAAILGLGYIPGLRTPSRYLLGLVLLVVLLKNYTGIIAGFQNFLTGSGTPTAVGAGAANPSSSYVAQNAPAAASGAAGQTGVAGTVNSAVNSTGVGSTISKLTGVPPLTLQFTPGGIADTISKMFGGG